MVCAILTAAAHKVEGSAIGPICGTIPAGKAAAKRGHTAQANVTTNERTIRYRFMNDGIALND
jgi:hypothetical protein